MLKSEYKLWTCVAFYQIFYCRRTSGSVTFCDLCGNAKTCCRKEA